MSTIAGRQARDFRIVVGTAPRRSIDLRRVFGIAATVEPVLRGYDIRITSSCAEVGGFIVRIVHRGIADVRGASRSVERKRPRLRSRGVGIE